MWARGVKPLQSASAPHPSLPCAALDTGDCGQEIAVSQLSIGEHWPATDSGSHAGMVAHVSRMALCPGCSADVAPTAISGCARAGDTGIVYSRAEARVLLDALQCEGQPHSEDLCSLKRRKR